MLASMINSKNPEIEILVKPSFRIFFALQQVILMEKARVQFGQIFSRIDIPAELRLFGKFSIFTDLLATLIRQGLASYPAQSTNRLVFITADFQAPELTVRVTDGGSGLRYQNRHLLRDIAATSTNSKSLPQLEKLIKTNFNGQVEIHNFAHKGTQVTLKFPAPNYNQSLGKS